MKKILTLILIFNYSCSKKTLFLVESLSSNGFFVVECNKNNIENTLNDFAYYQINYVEKIYYIDSTSNSMKRKFIANKSIKGNIYFMGLPPKNPLNPLDNFDPFEIYQCAYDTIGNTYNNTGFRYWEIKDANKITYYEKDWQEYPFTAIYNDNEFEMYFPADSMCRVSFQNVKKKRNCKTSPP